ncbi:MAG: tetratricopeptide repeat protein [Planctomycetota bacterium]
MSREQFRQAKRIFLEASERPQEGRAKFLEDACGGDEALMQDVQSLLTLHDREDLALEAPCFQNASDQTAVAQSHPEKIGAFRILSVLGEGGMGVVYLARQETPLRTVALKVIRPGIAGSEVLRRFQNEADVLARLRHPGIAQIYEAGTADTGFGAQPYFAMEPIEGIPITEFAEKAGLGAHQRLRLLRNVCDAVHHAHQKGVIHRDLKPSNILVDASGQPKIVDFGVARATDADIQATTLHTHVGELIGTLSYMSPEQITGDPHELDTRSDVYALGVIGYEVLTGRLPYELGGQTVPEAARMIREVDPTPLSSVSRLFRGDIETIMSKALEKDKDRRYQSASDLGADIDRFLRNEPITARPASAIYHFRKFASRNRALVGGLAAAFLALGVGASVATWQALRAVKAEKRAREEAATARQTKEFLVGLFEVSDPGTAIGNIITAREILDKGSERIKDELRDQPLIQAALMDTMGIVYTKLGLYDVAQGLLESALAIRRRELPNEHSDVATSINNLALVLQDKGDYREAERLHQEDLNIKRRRFGEEAPETLESLGNLAMLQSRMGNYDAAERTLRHVLALQRRRLGTKHPDVAITLNNLGAVLDTEGHYEEAEQLYREALAVRREAFGDIHPEVALCLNNLAILMLEKGDYERAERSFRDVLSMQHRLFGDEHPDIAITLNNLANVLRAQNKHAEATRLLGELLAMDRKLLGERHPDVARSMTNLAVALWEMGECDEAEPLFVDSLALQRELLGSEHPDLILALSNLSEVADWKGDFEAAIGLLGEALHIADVSLPREHPQLAVCWANMATVLHHQGKWSEAEQLYRKALEMLRRVSGQNDVFTLLFTSNLAELLGEQGRLSEAIPMCREVLDAQQQVLGKDHRYTLQSMRTLATLLRKGGEVIKAEEIYRSVLEARCRVLGEEHPDTLASRNDLADFLREQGCIREAESLFAVLMQLAPQTIPASHWQLGVFQSCFGACLTELGRYDEAETHLLEGYRRLEGALGAFHPRTREAIARLAKLYETLGRTDDAAKYRAMLHTADEAQTSASPRDQDHSGAAADDETGD